MTRQRVYKLIDEERDYQDTRWAAGRPMSDEFTPVAAWILYMEKHLQSAKERIYNLDETAALSQIRKITAIGVACMENNKTPARKETKE
ncbi:MAG: hemagglutinin [Ketobacter sp.]|nr:hemagglutinin [Ketobacter sp.]